MKFSSFSIVVLSTVVSSATVTAFTPTAFARIKNNQPLRTPSCCYGYLDDLSKDLYAEEDSPDVEATSYENTKLAEDKKDRYGVGDWSGFVDFDEFDGGDGQMGVAGDGNKGLEKFGSDVQPQLAKSKVMSAKNAWGKSTGYAEKLIEEGVEATRAQQLENWQNQQEIQRKRDQQRYMTEQFDNTPVDEDQWSLGKFGAERNQEFDLDETFGAIVAGNVDGTIELSSRIGQPAVYEMGIKNEYMGFADFRAAFTPETPAVFTVEPTEGSLSKEPTNFLLRFRPQAPGIVEGCLVIETEDFKKTYKLIGQTA